MSAGRGMVEGPILVEVHPQAALVAVSGGEERGSVEGDCLTCCSLVMASSVAAAWGLGPILAVELMPYCL